MKRTMIVGLLLLFSLAAVSGGCAGGSAEGGALPPEMEELSAANGGSSEPEAGKTAAVIGEDAAREAALKDAQSKESDVSRVEVGLDYEDGRRIYEVEFRSGDKKYEYEVDAYTGAILSSDYEIKKEPAAAGGSSQKSSPPKEGKPSSGNSVIGADAAKAAVLKHAGLSASKVSRLKVELDYEKGRQIYEVEFSSGGAEYEYEIDAYSGAVLSYEYEAKKVMAVEGGTLIGEDAAVAAALKHAQLARSAVSRVEVELDYEDGRQIYEVEFHSGNQEYEYEIDAYGGTILSFEVETRKTSK